MPDLPIEASYPLNFREADSANLGEHLKLRHCVELVGMTRVGISNFLRFFLYHEGVVKKYIDPSDKHMFCAVDLNDLVERELFPFWVLTFKRLVDKVEKFPISPLVKKKISALFLDCIQSNDLFLTTESLKEALLEVIKEGILPTIFFIRFDRLKDAVNVEFFANLESLRETTGQKLAYVFTSFRALDGISPTVFPRIALSVFSNVMYVKPAKREDTKTIFETFEKRYNISPTVPALEKIIELAGGHVQYLHLSLIIINQKIKGQKQKIDVDKLPQIISRDERVSLQSEEIWESLSLEEQIILKKVARHQKVTQKEETAGRYLWETGIISEDRIFSQLFFHYLGQKDEPSQRLEIVDFTKKENLLFKLLLSNIGEVCEREKMIEAVWPEAEEFGVSDWTIDRLVARLRNKLKRQSSQYAIVTVRTRGYKLIAER